MVQIKFVTCSTQTHAYWYNFWLIFSTDFHLGKILPQTRNIHKVLVCARKVFKRLKLNSTFCHIVFQCELYAALKFQLSIIPYNNKTNTRKLWFAKLATAWFTFCEYKSFSTGIRLWNTNPSRLRSCCDHKTSVSFIQNDGNAFFVDTYCAILSKSINEFHDWVIYVYVPIGHDVFLYPL